MTRCDQWAVRAAALLTLAAVPSVALSAQTTIEISTAAPVAAPQLHAPFTFAAFPGSALVLAIPASGQAPLAYAATGLPTGLTLAPDTGILSGTMPVAGSYPIQVTVTNGAGSASATWTLVSGDTLSLTPPAGWNSYDSFGASITESEVLEQARALKSQLQPFGWNYVVIDYRWYEPGQPIDGSGRYLPATSKYPSATGSTGLKHLSDEIHALGLGFGIHIMRGIPRKSVDANTPIANSTFSAKDAANTSDPCPWDQHMWGVRGDTRAGQDWYNSIFQQYAEWGVDFIKIDDMVNNDTHTYHQAEVDAIRAAISKSGRSIVLSLSPGPMPTADAAHLNQNANLWRMVNDFWDYKGLSTLSDVFTAAGNWQAITSLRAGHWPDADMLPLGYLGPRNEWHTSGQTTFSKNEQVTIMSLWSILPSPLLFGGNVVSLSSDDWTRALLTNEEIMGVNQDSSGSHAKRILQQGSTEVWMRDLSGARKAVAMFNRGSQDASVAVSFSQLGLTFTPKVRDLWRRADVTAGATGLSVTVPYNGAQLFAVSPPAAGMGGTSGADGASGSGGITASAGTAGTQPTAGTGIGGQFTGTAGDRGETTGGSGGGGKGGAATIMPAGGFAPTTSGGSDASNAGRAPDRADCGCRVPIGAPTAGFPYWLALVGFASVRRLRKHE